MYRGTIDLGRINPKMQLKFHLLLQDDSPQSSAVVSKKMINVFSISGNEYIVFNPIQYIEIDISKSGDKGDGYNPNTRISLNKKCLFSMIQKLKQIIDDFQEKEMFWTENGKLELNQELSFKKRQFVYTPSKVAVMQHAVVHDADNSEIDYEGMIFAINKYDNFVMLTYDEILFLYHELSNIDMHQLSLLLLQFELSTRGKLKTDYEVTQLENKPIEIHEEVDNAPEIRILPQIKTPNEVPDI